MQKRTLLVSGLVAAGTLLTACGSQSLSSTDGTAAPVGPDLSSVTFEDQTAKVEVKIDAIDNTFQPEYVEVSAGTTVTFRNDGRNQHNVIPTVSGTFEAIQADQFEPGTEKSVTFSKPGDYPYYCSLHGTTTKGMIGAIRVTEPPAG